MFPLLSLRNFKVCKFSVSALVSVVTLEMFSQEYAFLEETHADRLTKSTLIIRRSESKHFGSYNCTVLNAYGVDSVEINLVPASK